MSNPVPNPAAAQPSAPLTPAEDKQWASFAHFGGVVGALPALIIYLVFKDRGALVRQESKEALNWQITFTIGWIVMWIAVGLLSAVLFAVGAYGAIGLLGWLPFLLYIVNVVLSLLAGVQVNGGGSYRYPFAVRLIR